MAITSFVSELTHPRLPSLAVAAGSHIYIYRNLRPYYKFQVPPEDVNTEEQVSHQPFPYKLPVILAISQTVSLRLILMAHESI